MIAFDIFSDTVYTKHGDDMLNSAWTNNITLPSFPKLEHDLETEVLIIGGGLAGVLCAHALHQEGIDYALVEADRICNGVSRNTTAKITSQHGVIYNKLIREFGEMTARRYWEANEAALMKYRLLSDSIDCDFETRDSIIYATDDISELEKEMAALDRLRIPAEYIDNYDLPFPVAAAFRFENQAQFHPLKFVSEIVRGLNIYEHTSVRSFEGNTARIDFGTIRAKKIIIATHFPILNKHGSYFLKMYQERSYVIALRNAGHFKAMYRDQAKSGLSFRSYNDLLLIGGGGHRTGKKGNGWSDLEAFHRKYCPEGQEAFRWATQDCITLDGIPYIGQYSKNTPDLYVATGFNKWGMTSSMVASMILCDMVQGKENPYASVFSPSRSIFRPQLLCNAFESTVNLLTPTKPRCPHLGCALKWNPQEHSWDCPCHGSRFAEDGHLLDNPATGNMKNIQSS